MNSRKQLGAASLSATALAAVLGMAAVAQPAAAQQPTYPPVFVPDEETGEVGGGDSGGSPVITVSDVVVQPGAPVAVSATAGCLPGSTVDVVLLRLGSDPQVLTSTTTNATGGFAVSATVPASSTRGVYVFYTRCVDETGRIAVSALSFVIVPAGTEGRNDDGGAETSDGGVDSSAGGSLRTRGATAADVTGAGLTAADVPAMWTAPAGWSADAAEKAAVAEAVNLELAALRTQLVPSTGSTAGSATDIAPWAAAGAAGVFLLGAAGYRRRAVRADKGEVSA